MRPLDHLRRPWTLLLVALAAAAIALAVYRLMVAGGERAEREAAAGQGAAGAARADEREVPRYAAEYPSIGYSTTPPSDSIAELRRRLARGELELEHVPGRGYLDALLEALAIDPASQVLVFSRTSLQAGRIRPETPRAIFFNDDTYVAYVPGGSALEIASVDPRLGAVFYTLDHEDAGPAAFEQQLGRCLRCHDSLSLSGGGVPRFILGSGYVDTRGNLVSHEGSILTTYRTPLRSRWGGWYVTGLHGEQVHLGNIAVADVGELQNLERLRRGNLESLEGLLDTTPYPADTSDIVALMVLQHQVDAQNAIIRASYKTRTALAAARERARGSEGAAAGEDSGESASADTAGVVAGDAPALAQAREAVDREAEALVRTLLFAGEAELTAPIRGTAAFAERFERRGPHDRQGRSLRELDLRTRVFRYPLSYQIYSEAFDALPDVTRQRVYERLAEILGGGERGGDSGGDFEHLSAADRIAIREILSDTKPEFAAVAGDAE